VQHSAGSSRPSSTPLVDGPAWQSIVDNLKSVVFQTDGRGRWTFLNRAWTELTGFDVGASLGTFFLDYVHVDDRARNKRLLAPLFAREQDHCRHDVRYLTASRHARWIEVYARLTLDADDNVTGTTGTLTDVTERHDSEMALVESRYMLQTILDTTPARVYWKDASLRFLGGNRAFISDAGLSCNDSLVGRQESDLCWGEHAGALEAADRYVLATGLTHEREDERRRIASEGERALRVTRVPLRSANGAIIGVLGAYIDVTVQLSNLNALHTQQKMESVASLAGGIAHDFNNLLTAIVGNTSLALELLDSPAEVADCLADVLQATKDARTLTQKLLTFSRGGAPVTRPVDPVELVRDAVTTSLVGSAVLTEWSVQPNLPAVHVDEEQLRGALSAVTQNAAQAMPDGGVLRVRAELQRLTSPNPLCLSPGAYVFIELHDGGSGVPAEVRERVFEPFFTTRANHSGLGLTAAYSIITKHRGAILLASEPGQGTRVGVWLPVTTTDDDASARHFVATGRVLVLDDEPYIRTLATKLLKRFGFEVEAVADGEAAVRAVERAAQAGRRFTFALLDLTIPGGVGGAETLKRIRRIDPTIRAVVSSGYSDDPVMANPADYGFDAVLPKPYSLERMTKALRPLVA